VSINRMSFEETPNILNAPGFLNRLSLGLRLEDEAIFIKKGSLLFGFRTNNNDAYGFVYDNDVEIPPLSASTGNYYITVNNQGLFSLSLGNFSNVRGLGANITSMPWYTYNNKIIVAKVSKKAGIITDYIICDDAYWCEFEGGF